MSVVCLVTLVLLDLLLDGYNLPYECPHREDVIVVFLVTLGLLWLPYECTHWGDVIVVLFFYLGVAGYASKVIQLTLWMHTLRRCDCGIFGGLGVAGFAFREIQITIWRHSLRRCNCGVFGYFFLLDLLLEGFNSPYECTHCGDVIVVSLVTFVLMDLLLEGFNSPYECTHWGDVIVMFLVT